MVWRSDVNQTFAQHEQASVDMFRHMLEKNPPVREEFEKWSLSTEEHGKFVAELILGEPDENSPQVSQPLFVSQSLFVSQPLFVSQSQCTLNLQCTYVYM